MILNACRMGRRAVGCNAGEEAVRFTDYLALVGVGVFTHDALVVQDILEGLAGKTPVERGSTHETLGQPSREKQSQAEHQGHLLWPGLLGLWVSERPAMLSYLPGEPCAFVWGT